MQEFLDFLGKQAPYDKLDEDDLELLARRVEVEYFPAGAVIVDQDDDRLEQLAVIRTGLVQVLDGAHVVDELGPGDTFGELSVLSGLPPARTVRALTDTLLYLLPDPRPLLRDPERLRFRPSDSGVRALMIGAVDYGFRPVTEFMREPLWCEPGTSIRAAARAMSEGRHSCVLVALDGSGGLGIMTDSDCRRLVATGEVPVDAPVSTIVTSPVHTIEHTDPASLAFLTMVQRGVHHLVVTDDDGRAVGVCRVVDLSSADVRDPLAVRATIDAADTIEDLAVATAAIRPAMLDLYEGGVPPLRIGALMSVLVEAVVEKCIGWVEPFSQEDAGEYAWMFLGSLARREPLPVSDVDTALVWRAPEYVDRPEALREAADEVLKLVERCGLERCPDGANADNPLFNRPFDVWVLAARHWEEHSEGPGALLLSAMLADSRSITGLQLGRKLARRVRSTPENPVFRKRMLMEALSARPPLGFVKNVVVESDGEHKGQLDLKRRGLGPLVGIGRWISICTGSTIGSTQERLAQGVDADLLTVDESALLRHAHAEIFGLLFDSEVASLRSGAPASTYIDPEALNTLTRRQLRESFKAIARVQERLEDKWLSRLR